MNKQEKAKAHNDKHHGEKWKSYSMTDPNRTHPEVVLDVPIPSHWWSASYHNDVCPSFTFGKLQIWVMDRATKEREGFDTQYMITLHEDYGQDSVFTMQSNKWSEILKFVEENYKGGK